VYYYSEFEEMPAIEEHEQLLLPADEDWLYEENEGLSSTGIRIHMCRGRRGRERERKKEKYMGIYICIYMYIYICVCILNIYILYTYIYIPADAPPTHVSPVALQLWHIHE